MGTIYDHLELVGPRLLVRPLPDLGVTQSGLVLPDSGIHQQNRAIVEKVGPGELLEGPIADTRRPMTIAIGDLVLYQKFAGTWVILDEMKRLMLLEDEVQGRVPADTFTLVRHDDDNEHLEGEPCLTCLAPIQEAKNAAARADLEEQRRALVASSNSTS